MPDAYPAYLVSYVEHFLVQVVVGGAEANCVEAVGALDYVRPLNSPKHHVFGYLVLREGV